MTIVRRPSPLGELVSLRQAMDRSFEDSFVRPRWIPRAEASKPRQIRTSPTTDGQAALALKPETTGGQAQTNGVQA